MVKGNSKQVIVVQSPDPKLFEQAIFILRDDAVIQGGITEAQLMREANALIDKETAKGKVLSGPIWACLGAGVTGMLWLLSSLI